MSEPNFLGGDTIPRPDDDEQKLLAKILGKLDNGISVTPSGGSAATIADGADVTEGSVGDAAVAAGAVGTVSAKLRRATQGLEDLKTSIVLAAGTAVIGKTGIDQTTPGTTNRIVAAGVTADGAAASGNPVQIAGVAVNAASYAPAYTAGQVAKVAIGKDDGGALCNTRTSTTTDQITAQPLGQSFVNIATATTTVVKSGAGILSNIIINKHIAAGVITIYDNTSAADPKIGIITAGAALLTDPPICANYNLAFATGLTIVTSAAENITVVYR